jgi:pyruvate kinase
MSERVIPRRTKIVCTLGPATDDEPVLRDLLLAGMDVARLNFSHGTHDEHRQRIKTLMKLREEMRLPVALLLDTKGPEVRIQTFKEGKVFLKTGSTFILTTEEIEGDESRVSITYPNLPEEVGRGNRILLDDGLIELSVISTTSIEIECEVVNGGSLSNRKGVNIPGVSLKLPFISEKDREDIEFGARQGFDFVAASFTRNAGDIRDLRRFLESLDAGHIKIISKIENHEGYSNIEEIIRVSDGIMVARGDMGVEIPFEELPAIQKNIIQRCYGAGKPVITATQMLDSMIRNPRPTRAELTDVANAVYDGTSALMLSGETSIGKYPVESVQTMHKIALKTEGSINYIHRFNSTHNQVPNNVTAAIGHATCSTAHTLGASAIITVTKSGYTGRIISRFRPAVPIIATTITERVYRQLALNWGVRPIMSNEKGTTDEVFDQAIERSMETGIIMNGDLVVLTGGIPVGISGTTNTIKVHIVGDVIARGEGINGFKATGNLCVANESCDYLETFNVGDILVISSSTDDVLPMIKNAAALVTEEESNDSKAAIVGKALEIPVITGVTGATGILKSGSLVTIDAEKGYVYSGIH